MEIVAFEFNFPGDLKVAELFCCSQLNSTVQTYSSGSESPETLLGCKTTKAELKRDNLAP